MIAVLGVNLALSRNTQTTNILTISSIVQSWLSVKMHEHFARLPWVTTWQACEAKQWDASSIYCFSPKTGLKQSFRPTSSAHVCTAVPTTLRWCIALTSRPQDRHCFVKSKFGHNIFSLASIWIKAFPSNSKNKVHLEPIHVTKTWPFRILLNCERSTLTFSLTDLVHLSSEVSKLSL